MIQNIIEKKIMTDGDDDEIQNQIDMIHEIQEVRDSDHVIHDIMYQVHENGVL